MTSPKVIKATFSDWRPVKGRKVLQMVFEVPLEQTSEVLTMLGAPMPDAETWCAIALLDMQKFDADGNLPDEDKNYHEGEPVYESPTPRRAFCDLPMPQQAGIKSADLRFQLFMSTLPVGKESEDAASAIRAFCGVTSRADIQTGTKAGERWLALLREFEGIR